MYSSPCSRNSQRCLHCVTLHVNTEPGVNVEEEDEEDSDEFSNPYESDHVGYDITPLACHQ